MNLLFLSNVFPGPLHPAKGTFNRSLVGALAEQHTVRVVSPVSWLERLRARWKRTADPLSAEIDGIPVTYPTVYYPPKVSRSRYDDWMMWSLRRHLLAETQAFRPDAILSYWVHPDGSCATRLAKEIGVPSVVMTGGSDVLLLGRSGARRRRILATLALADAVIAVSGNLRDRLVADGLPADRIHVVHRGLNHNVFHPQPIGDARSRLNQPSDRRLIVGVGRLVPVKGWELLIDACGVLHRKGRRFACVIVGGGELQGALRRRIENLGLEQVVTLAGARPQSELADWYRAADVVALTSLSEGIPNVLLEAMSCGTRWVATDVGGVREIADPEAHRTVTSRDPEELASALEATWSLGPVDPRTLTFQPDDWRGSAARVAEIVAECLSVGGARDSSRGGARQPHVLGAGGGTSWA